MNAEPIALRVVRHHRAALLLRNVPTVTKRVEYTDGGRISAAALATMLEAQLGFVVRLRFRPAPDGPRATVAWEAMNEKAELVTGTLVLHAAVAEDQVTTRAVVTVDPR